MSSTPESPFHSRGTYVLILLASLLTCTALAVALVFMSDSALERVDVPAIVLVFLLGGWVIIHAAVCLAQVSMLKKMGY